MYEVVYVCGGIGLQTLLRAVVKRKYHKDKVEPCLGDVKKSRSFDEQKYIMERCSILFNTTDFCLVIFS